jgi:hypothetical protein
MVCCIFTKKMTMKFALIPVLVLLLISCGTKVPFNNEIRERFDLNTDKDLRKVQFFTSQTIILEKSKSSGNQGTTDAGALVTNSNKEENRVIIPIFTKCVFDGFGPNGELMLRFELGTGKTISFSVKSKEPTAKYYLNAEWTVNQGGKLQYGNEQFSTMSTSGNAYLLVVTRRLQKTKRKDRVVKGMKV